METQSEFDNANSSHFDRNNFDSECGDLFSNYSSLNLYFSATVAFFKIHA